MQTVLYGDGVHDDSQALQAWLDGQPVVEPNGTPINPLSIFGKTFLINGTVRWHSQHPKPNISLAMCHFVNGPLNDGVIIDVRCQFRHENEADCGEGCKKGPSHLTLDTCHFWQWEQWQNKPECDLTDAVLHADIIE